MSAWYAYPRLLRFNCVSFFPSNHISGTFPSQWVWTPRQYSPLFGTPSDASVAVKLQTPAFPDKTLLPFPEGSFVKCKYVTFDFNWDTNTELWYTYSGVKSPDSYSVVDAGTFDLSTLSWSYNSELGVFESQELFTMHPITNVYKDFYDILNSPCTAQVGPYLSLEDASTSAMGYLQGNRYWGSPTGFSQNIYNTTISTATLPAFLPIGSQVITRLGATSSIVLKSGVSYAGFEDNSTWWKSVQISESTDPNYQVGTIWNFDPLFAPSTAYRLEEQTNTTRKWRKDADTFLVITLSEPYSYSEAPKLQGHQDCGDFIIQQPPLLGELSLFQLPDWYQGEMPSGWPADFVGKITVVNFAPWLFPVEGTIAWANENHWPESFRYFNTDTEGSLDIGTAEVLLWSQANGVERRTLSFTQSKLRWGALSQYFDFENQRPYETSCWQADIGSDHFLISVLSYTGPLAEGYGIASDNRYVQLADAFNAGHFGGNNGLGPYPAWAQLPVPSS